MKKSTPFFLLLSIAIITNALALFFLLPKAQETIKETNAVNRIVNIIKSPKLVREKTDIDLFFVYPSVLDSKSYSIRKFTSSVEDNNREFIILETLLKGPTIKALNSGCITCINSKTKLLGFNSFPPYAYINLSKAFIENSTNLTYQIEASKKQLFKTISQFQDLRKLNILVEGQFFTSITESEI